MALKKPLQEKSVTPVTFFSARLRSLMQQRDLTQREVAKAAGVSRTAIVKWLKGSIPGAGELFRLARFFGQPMESFLAMFPEAPASEADDAALLRDPEAFPVNKLKSIAPLIGLTANAEVEELLELLLQAKKMTPQHWDAYIRILGRARIVATDTENKVLTDNAIIPTLAPVKSSLETLRSRLKRATQARGKKTELARFLRMSPESVSRYLGSVEPGGETTLRILQWVEEQERQTKSPGSAQTRPERKTQSRKSTYEKPKSGPQKR
jgi:transcriptional regulator with XRE-family HTH domain